MKIPLLIIAAIAAATNFPSVISAVASLGVSALTYLLALTYIALLFLLLVRPIARHIHRQLFALHEIAHPRGPLLRLPATHDTNRLREHS